MSGARISAACGQLGRSRTEGLPPTPFTAMGEGDGRVAGPQGSTTCAPVGRADGRDTSRCRGRAIEGVGA